MLGRIRLDPARQLIVAQCSGTLLLARLGLIGDLPACTDLTTRPWVIEAGVEVLDAPFVAHGNVATARSEEHTSELQAIKRTSYYAFCLQKKNKQSKTINSI